MSTPRDHSGDFEDVGDFHEKFGLHSVNEAGPGPTAVDAELMEFRVNFLLEEIGELVQALGGKIDISDIVVAGSRSVRASIPEGAKIDHAEAFDALLDLNYVSLGTAHLLGYPWAEGWHMVQTANMSKVRAKPDGSDSKRGSSFDVVKPEGWRPPNIGGLLKAFGFHTDEKEPNE